jgi:hypothetical protein
MTMTLVSAIVALGLAGAAQPAASAPAQSLARVSAAHPQVTVRVENDNFLDARVYALSNGFAYPLGIAAGLLPSTFTLPPSAVEQGTDVRLIFSLIGSPGYWVSPPLLVSPGDHVVSRVGNLLTFSTISVQ